MLKKVLVWGGITFVVFFIAFRPSAAAAFVKAVGQTAYDITEGVGQWFASLVG